jgi:hypothetical protein
MHANESNYEKQPRNRNASARAGIFISKQTFDTILRQKTRRADMLALLIFYHYTALWQGTNQPRASLKYVMKGLHWGRDKVQAARSLLLKLKLIADVRVTDHRTGKVTGWFIRLPYFHPTDLPAGGFYHRVDSEATNALRSVKGNALRSVKTNASYTHAARADLVLNGLTEKAREVIEHYHETLVPLDWFPVKEITREIKRVFDVAATADELHDLIDAAADAAPDKWPNTRSFVNLYWRTRKRKPRTRKHTGRSLPIAKRNEIINRLNTRKAQIMRAFPDGKFAPWAEEELASIQRQLHKL